MEEITIRATRPADFYSIAKIISSHNQTPESHCIQSSSTDDASAIAEEIEELYVKDELRLIVAELDGQIVGLIGCEFDESVGRGWMRGPFLTQDRWEDMPGKLLEVLQATLPPAIKRLDSFLNEENAHGQHFYTQNGFRHAGLVHVYQAQADGHGFSGTRECLKIQPEQEQAFIALHDTVFPVTFIDGRGILEQLDEDHKLISYGKDSSLDGYLYLSVDKFSGEGYIEFIAVQPELRGKGIGKGLLLCALDWCFSTRQLARVNLTVHEELTNAQSLYESVGFRHLYTGVNHRREW
jgi:ribosomal protein S18 acetylase RimI-like enzyme